MALRNVLVEASPDQVWATLADGRSYADWVVGTRAIRDVDEGWPREGTRLHYTAGFGPLRLEDITVVRLCEPTERLELEAHAMGFGTVRISIQVMPWGDDSLVILDEHPLRGPGLALENPLADFLLTVRNRVMLRRLRRVVERQAQ